MTKTPHEIFDGEIMIKTERKKYKCEECKDTGWGGDLGPGIRGNNEYAPCDCRAKTGMTTGKIPNRLSYYARIEREEILEMIEAESVFSGSEMFSAVETTVRSAICSKIKQRGKGGE